MPLSDRRARTAGPGRHGDGRGLYLLVKPSGTRSWLLRFTDQNRKRRDMGLGPYPEITLAGAREKALEVRRRVLDGEDPIAERRRAQGLTFRAAAEQLIENKRTGWRNARHAAQWSTSLTSDVYPIIGERDVKTVDLAAVMAVLRPIWNRKPESASRIRQRMEAVLDYAKVIGARTGENPARWRGNLDQLLPKPKSVRPVRHHTALDWREAPALMAQLRESGDVVPRALAFLMLTAARAGEVRGMSWREVDLKANVWTVPADRIKAAREHRVPLVVDAIALLGAPGAGDHLVFESPVYPGRPLAGATFGAALRRLDRGDLTVHGLRSTFRDWAGETTPHPREVVEAALAHRLQDRAEAAYARGDLFNKRRMLMQDWADFLTGELADVVPLVPHQRSR